MKIVHLASEFSPIAKEGGLGDVLVGLCRELSRKGKNVEVIIPKYDFIDMDKLRFLRMEVPDFKSFENGNLHANAMWSADVEECNLHLLEARHPAGYFHRGKIYGCDDDCNRFLYFSRAVLEYLKLKNDPIDVLHLHDWHTAICAPLIHDLFQLPIKSILLTLHNVEHQGKCHVQDLDAIGLKGSSYLTKEKMQDDDPSYPNRINILKGGVVYADRVNTVSPTYAKEILTPEMGFHLDPTFRKYKFKLSGILNGLDDKLWNPAHDPALPASFDRKSSIDAITKAKGAARELFQKQFGLNANRRPWVGTVMRLVQQKGPELIEEGIRHTLDAGGTFLLIGSSPNPEIRGRFEALKAQFAESKQLMIHLGFDEALAHQTYAALDFFLIPSQYEPCGLAQMIAMHYGAVPIARATGGLRDTVFDCEDSKISAKERNGFLFIKSNPKELNATLQRAFKLFKKESAVFQSLIRRGIDRDFSWKGPAEAYAQLYNRIAKKSALSQRVSSAFLM